MKLAFIRGSQARKNPDDLKNIWIENLKIGLKRSALDLPLDENDVIFPYYGDLLDQLIIYYDTPIVGIIKKGTQSGLGDARFFHNFFIRSGFKFRHFFS